MVVSKRFVIKMLKIQDIHKINQFTGTYHVIVTVKSSMYVMFHNSVLLWRVYTVQWCTLVVVYTLYSGVHTVQWCTLVVVYTLYSGIVMIHNIVSASRVIP